jgi:hypothetical protein
MVKNEHLHSTKFIYFYELDKISIMILIVYVYSLGLKKYHFYNNLEHYSQNIKTIYYFLDAIFPFYDCLRDANYRLVLMQLTT